MKENNEKKMKDEDEISKLIKTKRLQLLYTSFHSSVVSSSGSSQIVIKPTKTIRKKGRYNWLVLHY